MSSAGQGQFPVASVRSVGRLEAWEIVVSVLFAPIHPFIWHPERIAAVAIALGLAAAVSFFLRRRVPWATVVAAVIWALFALWEWYCAVQRYNIRVDLMLIYPVLLAVTIGGVVDAVLPGITAKR